MAIDVQANIDRSIAYVLSPDAWEHGYATESLPWLLNFLKATGAVDIARAQIDDRNAASQRVVERLQFDRVYERTV